MKAKRRIRQLPVQEAFHAEPRGRDIDINTGARLNNREEPWLDRAHGDLKDLLRWCRAMASNYFVAQILQKKREFYNYGLKIVPADKGGKKKLDAYFRDTPGEMMRLRRFIRESWDEFNLLDSVIAFWRQEAKVKPNLLAPERCDYTDRFGNERLIVHMNFKAEELKGFPRALAERYANKRVELSERFDEYYSVMTMGRRGYGLCEPRLKGLFMALQQNDHMEVGEAAYAFAGRSVERRTSIGFEVKAAANALKQSTFLYKKTRADAILKGYKGKQGFFDSVGQFDQKTEFIWIDPKNYDERKWGTIVQRMVWWGGPLAFMFIMKQLNINLLLMLKTEAEERREDLQLWLEDVINRGWGLPVAIRLKWSNDCFKDLRLAWDMMKFFVTTGSLSHTTSLTQAGYDVDVERQNKKTELDEQEVWVPVYDAAHGNRPGSEAGRPPKNPGVKGANK